AGTGPATRSGPPRGGVARDEPPPLLRPPPRRPRPARSGKRSGRDALRPPVAPGALRAPPWTRVPPPGRDGIRRHATGFHRRAPHPVRQDRPRRGLGGRRGVRRRRHPVRVRGALL